MNTLVFMLSFQRHFHDHFYTSDMIMQVRPMTTALGSVFQRSPNSRCKEPKPGSLIFSCYLRGALILLTVKVRRPAFCSRSQPPADALNFSTYYRCYRLHIPSTRIRNALRLLALCRGSFLALCSHCRSS